MYQVILSNYDFTFIDGDYFDSYDTMIDFINNKIKQYLNSDYKRIENIYVKDSDYQIEVRRMIGFQELKTLETENSYITLVSYNRSKDKWDKAGIKYSDLNLPNYSIIDKAFNYISLGQILKSNLDSINNFLDPDRLREYIVELFINNRADPKLIYNKIIYLRQRRTVEQIIKFCYDTILASEDLITI